MMAPPSCAIQYRKARGMLSFLVIRKARVTAGFRCPPADQRQVSHHMMAKHLT